MASLAKVGMIPRPEKAMTSPCLIGFGRLLYVMIMSDWSSE